MRRKLPLAPRAILLFDIDGVIRDVGGSYRRALSQTVCHYCGWQPDPAQIDTLKSEGRWNNDWEASMELLRRRGHTPLPRFEDLVNVFSGFYFGGDPDGDPDQWDGFIGSEPLLIGSSFFNSLTEAEFAWGFVSGAEPPSARYVLEQRLGLQEPPLIAMGDAPDKPDPTGLLQLAERLAQTRGGTPLGPDAPPVGYLGDTVADVQTVVRARRERPGQRLLSLAVAPPHLHAPDQRQERDRYERCLKEAGADRIIDSTSGVIDAFASLID